MAGTPDRTFQPFRSLYARAKLPTVEAPPVAASMSQSFWHHEIVYIQGIYVQILNIYIYVCMYVCMCIYIYVCVYIYVYIYIYTFLLLLSLLFILLLLLILLVLLLLLLLYYKYVYIYICCYIVILIHLFISLVSFLNILLSCCFGIFLVCPMSCWWENNFSPCTTCRHATLQLLIHAANVQR
jgi:hypothetical protein